MKTKLLCRLIMVLIIPFLVCIIQQPVIADETASTIRLIRQEGSVTVEDADGAARPVMDNMRFNSGDVLSTGEDSLASVSLDEVKILTVDENSQVAFEQSAKKLKLTLKEGEMLLDVQEKLDANESLDIQTSTMAVGIRGTIVFVGDRVDPDSENGRITSFGVLEGTADVSYQDNAGSGQTVSIPAGQILVLHDADGNGQADAKPEAADMTFQDIAGFVADQIQEDDKLTERISTACDVLNNENDAFAADGDWTWDEPVTFIAQSASKLYDGSALTRPSDVLVNGIPSDFSVTAQANGSQTDAGTGNNPVSSYAILNKTGEDVTKHFTQIKTIDGKLTVDPAPLTVWTDSAS
ncbi:MAG: FecR domain-containing protein, partial [Eubacterium sp.]|nr:FecR domain-containing protein [Eubacterium sp.]